jgi:2,3-bisphosphoglycerate-dependent phosphoglycerate mutase
MTKLFIARHGNTFDKGDVLLRVGKKTDIPLSQSGIKQAIKLGEFFTDEAIEFDEIFSSNLKRTKETARIVLEKMSRSDVNVIPMDIFDEIDYGPDEGKPEEEVAARVGREAIVRWDKEAIAPEGWGVDIEKIKSNWIKFAESIKDSDETILIVTSNGIARFAPYILNDPGHFIENNNIKLSTGAVSSLSYNEGEWKVNYWNKRP